MNLELITPEAATPEQPAGLRDRLTGEYVENFQIESFDIDPEDAVTEEGLHVTLNCRLVQDMQIYRTPEDLPNQTGTIASRMVRKLTEMIPRYLLHNDAELRRLLGRLQMYFDTGFDELREARAEQLLQEAQRQSQLGTRHGGVMNLRAQTQQIIFVGSPVGEVFTMGQPLTMRNGEVFAALPNEQVIGQFVSQDQNGVLTMLPTGSGILMEVGQPQPPQPRHEPRVDTGFPSRNFSALRERFMAHLVSQTVPQFTAEEVQDSGLLEREAQDLIANGPRPKQICPRPLDLDLVVRRLAPVRPTSIEA